MSYEVECPYCANNIDIEDEVAMDAVVKGISLFDCYKCEKKFYVRGHLDLDASRNCTVNDENHSCIATTRSNGCTVYDCTKCGSKGCDTDERPDKRFRDHVIKKI